MNEDFAASITSRVVFFVLVLLAIIPEIDIRLTTEVLEMKWVDMVQTLGIIGSILLVGWQIRIQLKQMKSNAEIALSTKVDEINRLMFEHPKVFPMLNQKYPAKELSNEGDPRYHLMHIIFNTFEQAYCQHGYKLIRPEGWNSWIQTMTEILRKPYAEGHWEAMKGQYTKDFQRFIDDLKKRSIIRENSLPPKPSTSNLKSSL